MDELALLRTNIMFNFERQYERNGTTMFLIVTGTLPWRHAASAFAGYSRVLLIPRRNLPDVRSWCDEHEYEWKEPRRNVVAVNLPDDASVLFFKLRWA